MLDNNLGETSGRLEVRMATMCFLLLWTFKHGGHPLTAAADIVLEDCALSWTRQLGSTPK